MDLKTGVQSTLVSENYKTLEDGILAMENIVRKLTGVSVLLGHSLADELAAIRKRAAAFSGRTRRPSGGNAVVYGALNLVGGLALLYRETGAGWSALPVTAPQRG